MVCIYFGIRNPNDWYNARRHTPHEPRNVELSHGSSGPFVSFGLQHASQMESQASIGFGWVHFFPVKINLHADFDL